MTNRTITELEDAIYKAEHAIYNRLKQIEAEFGVNVNAVHLGTVRQINQPKEMLMNVSVAVDITGINHGE